MFFRERRAKSETMFLLSSRSVRSISVMVPRHIRAEWRTQLRRMPEKESSKVYVHRRKECPWRNSEMDFTFSGAMPGTVFGDVDRISRLKLMTLLYTALLIIMLSCPGISTSVSLLEAPVDHRWDLLGSSMLLNKSLSDPSTLLHDIKNDGFTFSSIICNQGITQCVGTYVRPSRECEVTAVT